MHALSRFLLAAALCVPALAPAAPLRPATPASAPPPAAHDRSDKSTTSPTVRAGQDAEMPGELRPENRVLPQLSVPLRRDRPAARAAGTPSGQDPIDDSAARKAAGRRK
jgi:hypothetical protein